jgi:hypothetical protein
MLVYNKQFIFQYAGYELIPNNDTLFASVMACPLVLLPLQPVLRTGGCCSGFYSTAVL